jgi:hypothetical protein
MKEQRGWRRKGTTSVQIGSAAMKQEDARSVQAGWTTPSAPAASALLAIA